MAMNPQTLDDVKQLVYERIGKLSEALDTRPDFIPEFVDLVELVWDLEAASGRGGCPSRQDYQPQR